MRIVTPDKKLSSIHLDAVADLCRGQSSRYSLEFAPFFANPFLLVLRDIKTDIEQILSIFWTYGKSNIPRGGQFPPLLTLEEWKMLFRRLDASFDDLKERIRLRACQLYEQRGRGDGHALDDWLQAEAELKGQKALRAAA